MFGIGLPEMILIMALALIVVGPDKLPELARSIAKGVLELKRTVNSLKDDLAKENPLDSVKPEIEDAARSLRKQLGDPGPDGYTGGGDHQVIDPYEQAIRTHGVDAEPIDSDVGEIDEAAAAPEVTSSGESSSPPAEPSETELIENEAGVDPDEVRKTDPSPPDQTVH